MKITGNKIYELLQLWGTRKDSLETEFDDALMVFENEEKRSPADIERELMDAEDAVVTLQNAQRAFNRQVKTRDGASLDAAIKLQGTLKRAVRRWTKALQSSGYERYTRSKEMDYAKPTIKKDDVKKMIEKYTKDLLALRSATSDANGVALELDIPDSLTS